MNSSPPEQYSPLEVRTHTLAAFDTRLHAKRHPVRLRIIPHPLQELDRVESFRFEHAIECIHGATDWVNPVDPRDTDVLDTICADIRTALPLFDALLVAVHVNMDDETYVFTPLPTAH